MNVLFVCSKNQWRSPTAEKVFSMQPEISARSRGTTRDARRTVTSADVKWADVVMVMEQKAQTKALCGISGGDEI